MKIRSHSNKQLAFHDVRVMLISVRCIFIFHPIAWTHNNSTPKNERKKNCCCNERRKFMEVGKNLLFYRYWQKHEFQSYWNMPETYFHKGIHHFHKTFSLQLICHLIESHSKFNISHEEILYSNFHQSQSGKCQ